MSENDMPAPWATARQPEQGSAIWHLPVPVPVPSTGRCIETLHVSGHHEEGVPPLWTIRPVVPFAAFEASLRNAIKCPTGAVRARDAAEALRAIGIIDENSGDEAELIEALQAERSRLLASIKAQDWVDRAEQAGKPEPVSAEEPEEDRFPSRVGERTPDYYRFGDFEVLDITRHLTANAAQAVQYLARSSRVNGPNKGDLISDLAKARVLVEDELALRAWEQARMDRGKR